MEWFFGFVYVVAIVLPLMSVVAKVTADIKYPYRSQEWWRMADRAFALLIAGVLLGLVAVVLADNKAQVLTVATCVLAAVLVLCWRGFAEVVCKLAFFFTSKSYIASLKARRATTRRRLSDTID